MKKILLLLACTLLLALSSQIFAVVKQDFEIKLGDQYPEYKQLKGIKLRCDFYDENFKKTPLSKTKISFEKGTITINSLTYDQDKVFSIICNNEIHKLSETLYRCKADYKKEAKLKSLECHTEKPEKRA